MPSKICDWVTSAEALPWPDRTLDKPTAQMPACKLSIALAHTVVQVCMTNCKCNNSHFGMILSRLPAETALSSNSKKSKRTEMFGAVRRLVKRSQRVEGFPNHTVSRWQCNAGQSCKLQLLLYFQQALGHAWHGTQTCSVDKERQVLETAMTVP